MRGSRGAIMNKALVFAFSVLVALLAVVWTLWPVSTGICHYSPSRLRCLPSAMCDLSWVSSWSATCVRVSPKLPPKHPPVSRANAGTFCGLALDEDGYVVISSMREWGMYEWFFAVGAFNWSMVALLWVYDSCFRTRRPASGEDTDAGVANSAPLEKLGAMAQRPSETQEDDRDT